jgi:hypothetical protein
MEYALEDAKKIMAGTYRPVGSMPNAICLEYTGRFAVGFSGHRRNISSWGLDTPKEEIIADLTARGLGGIFRKFICLESQAMSIKNIPKEFVMNFQGDGRGLHSCHGENLTVFYLLLEVEGDEKDFKRGHVVTIPDGRNFRIMGSGGDPRNTSSMWFEEVS